MRTFLNPRGSKLHRLITDDFYVGAVKQRIPSALLPLVHPQANLRKFFLHHHLPSSKVQQAPLLVPQSRSTRCRLWKKNKATAAKDQHRRHCAQSACSLIPFLCGDCHLNPPGRYPMASFRHTLLTSC